MPFTFRLQALLEHKARIERERRGTLAAAAALVDAATAELARLNEELRTISAPHALRLQHLRAEYLARAIVRQESVVRTCGADEEVARESLRAAATEKMALEKLRRRRHAAYLAARERFEQTELEETNRH